MRLASYSVAGESSWGALVSGGIYDLKSHMPEYDTLRDAIEWQAFEAIDKLIEGDPAPHYSISDVTFDPVIPNARQILCIGLNYEEHRLETRREKQGYPTVFARYAASQVGHGAPILLPPESTMLDYEGELAIVIGKTCRRVPEEDAFSVIAGYACYNDASIRDFQKHTSQFHPGKNFPSTGAFGPWLVTKDEIPDVEQLTIETRLNGQLVQSGTLGNLIYTLPQLVAYCSTFTELRAGDVIVTGTPGGVGMARQPQLWMKAGDDIVVDIKGVGLLSNTVLRESVDEVIDGALVTKDQIRSV
ncbi:fumarylacetoacetate hydrolase family protein [Pseudomonas sp. W5-01]|uniref:fumarylacetoacetate hydrolase family protein n=1 Tax=Pseudomonas sp. W5-01 TaxID=3097454 RepID=UPI0039788FCB